jgi:tetratricopeptide (TPR) repeat protein
MDRRENAVDNHPMDEALVLAARALARGDALFALKRVALRDDAEALALRATALAQLGEYADAKQLFRRAARGFRAHSPVAHARCIVALSEVALAARELDAKDAALQSAIAVLREQRDLANARYGQMLRARHALALGQVELARERLSAIDVRDAAQALLASIALLSAEAALRRIEPSQARKFLARAAEAARRARIPALAAEVAKAHESLSRPVARLVIRESSRLLTIEDVSALLQGRGLIVDACHRLVRKEAWSVGFEARPVLFSLLRTLAERAPDGVSREELVRASFGMRRLNDSLRARLRVAVGRLRTLLAPVAELIATPDGFALRPRGQSLHVIAPPLDDQVSSLLALISDGAAWSSSALALALGASQRSVQRALGGLEEAGKVESRGSGRSLRWLAPPLARFAPHLLLSRPSPAP